MFYLQRENKICGFCHAELVSGSLTERIEKYPRLEKRDRVRCLTEQEQSEILRSSSTDVLQSNGLSLRMTNAFDNHNKCRHPEQSEGSLAEEIAIENGLTPHPSLPPKAKEISCCHAELVSGSLTERTGQFPSPREEGLGERVQLKEKINPSLKIVSFRKKLKDNFSLSLGESSGCPVKHQVRAFCKKSAFTLAEVLITIGIIGVVAAITIPGLNQAYKNQAAATKLRKFHSIMNQAIRMAENDYGDKKDWLDAHQGCDYIRPEFVEYDVDDNLVAGDTQTEKFFNKFFAPYLKISHVKHLSNGSFVVYFPDGSALSPGPDYPTTKCYNWMYFPGNPDRCGYTKNTFEDKQGGKCRFSFTLRLGLRENQQPFGFQPFYYGNELPSRAKLRSDCTNYGTSCTALIKYDGWRVAPDYPKNRKIRF